MYIEVQVRYLNHIFSAYSEPMYLFGLINLGVSSFLNKKAEIERYQHEKEEKAFLQSVMHLQDNLIVITDGKDI